MLIGGMRKLNTINNIAACAAFPWVIGLFAYDNAVFLGFCLSLGF
jgi:hypothetical protein